MMLRKFFFIFLIEIIYFQTSNSIYYGHEIGGTSLDSTDYDRQLFQQQCSMKKQLKQRYQSMYLININSSSIDNSNNSNSTLENNTISIIQRLDIDYDDDRLVTRTSSDTINTNVTHPLGLDEASIDLVVNKQLSGNLTVYVQIIECVRCPYELIAEDLSANKIINLTLNTKFNYYIRIETVNKSYCVEKLNLNEHNQYVLEIGTNLSMNSSFDSHLKCTLMVRYSSMSVYIPMIVAGIILLVLFVLCIIAERFDIYEHFLKIKKRLSKRAPSQESAHSYDLQACSLQPTTSNNQIHATADGNPSVTKLPPIHKASNAAVPRSKRLLSLDGFRGFALVAMIFVNYGGGGYAEFEHAPWHGITFADVVFPFFVWMLGTSLVFSLKNSIDRGVSKRMLLKKVVIRTIKLFAIGFILNTRFKADLSVVRIPGVLQRFAIVYAIIATIEVLCTKSQQYSLSNQKPLSSKTVIQKAVTFTLDIINFPFQWLIIIILVTIWVLVIYLVPFENCPAGYLGPGGLHENGKYINCTGGITGYIDRMIFTSKHLYGYPTCRTVYGCKPPFDPENLFGAIPTVFLAFLGVQAGRILVIYDKHIDRLVRLFVWSVINIVIGVGLTAGTLNDGPMPLNKNIWTLSFSFFTAGLAFAVFAVMYIFIDMLKWWNATPFQYPGMNSILIYITHLVFATYFPIQWVVVNTHAAHLAMSLWGCIFWIIMAYIFYRKRLFLVL